MNILKNLDALLITNPTNIRYLTGFVGAAPDEREAYVLLTKSQTYLFTNALYQEKAKKLTSLKRLNLLASKGLTFIETSRENPFAKKLAEIMAGCNPAKCLGFEENDLTVAEYQKLKKELIGITLVPTKGRIEELRMIKRKDEIANISAAAKLTDQCFDFILGKIKIGVTETDIAWEIESFIRKNGASLAFSPIVAFGKNSSQPHYLRSVFARGPLAKLQEDLLQTALRSSDIILLDFGAKINGYCSDMTRVVFVGKPKDEWRQAYNTVFDAQHAALEYLHLEGVKAHLPGDVRRSGADADHIARRVIERAGYPTYPHSLGHGVGLAIHEIPRFIARKDRILPKPQPQKDAILLPGMVVTVEPGIYIEGQYGIRIEDLVLIRDNGIEILSVSSKKFTIL